MNAKRVRLPWHFRFWKFVRRTDTCWEWTGATKAGYGKFAMSGAQPSMFAHRVSYESAYGAIPAGKHVCHRCDNPLCIRPDHLWLGTPKENMWDAIRKGRAPQLKRVI